MEQVLSQFDMIEQPILEKRMIKSNAITKAMEKIISVAFEKSYFDTLPHEITEKIPSHLDVDHLKKIAEFEF